MTDFTVIEAKAWHCGAIARRLRREHRNALSAAGVDIHRELRSMFDASAFRRAWLIDGDLAAIGGVAGTALSVTGYVWVAMTEQAARYPVALVKEARRQLGEIMGIQRELATTVIPDDPAAARLAVFLGFHVSHEGRGQRALSRFSRRDLIRFIATDENLRIPVGKAYAIAMGYHHDIEEAA